MVTLTYACGTANLHAFVNFAYKNHALTACSLSHPYFCIFNHRRKACKTAFVTKNVCKFDMISLFILEFF